MGIQAENTQWFKGKIPIITEYSETHRAMLSTIASRGFCHAPGYLFEAAIAIEEVGKNKLSALNYTIVAEAVQRELTQTGHTYTQAYKAARIAFELEKQTLLTALQNEFADLDATQSLKKEELDRRFIELDIRKLILITTKTTIEFQMEGLKQELVGIDRLTFTNEEALINEKVVTATAKLAVIPYLEALIESQEKILAAETVNISHMEDLINEKGLLVDKKIELVPHLVNKSAKLIELATATLTAIGIEENRLVVALSKAILGTDKVDNALDVLEAEAAITDLRGILQSAQNDLQLTRIGRTVSLADLDSENISEISTGHSAMMSAMEDYKTAIASSIRDAKGIVSGGNLASDEETTDIGVNADAASIRYVASYGASATRQTAVAAATAKITSELIHLIGS